MPGHLIEIVLLVHAGSTWFMVGLIWFVQAVHYPLMARIGGAAFAEYALAHQRRTSWVVGPMMLIEASASVMLIWIGPRDAALRWTGPLLLALVWLSTFLVQVPLHARLARGFDRGLVRRLVATNWVRTVGWTARGLVALLLLHAWAQRAP